MADGTRIAGAWRQRFELTVLVASVVLLGAPFLAPWIVSSHPKAYAVVGSGIGTLFDEMVAFCFGAVLCISLVTNLVIFAVRWRRAEEPSPPRLLAVFQGCLLVLMLLWLLTLHLNVTVLGRAGPVYALIWLEGSLLSVLSVVVLERVFSQFPARKPLGPVTRSAIIWGD